MQYLLLTFQNSMNDSKRHSMLRILNRYVTCSRVKRVLEAVTKYREISKCRLTFRWQILVTIREQSCTHVYGVYKDWYSKSRISMMIRVRKIEGKVDGRRKKISSPSSQEENCSHQFNSSPILRKAVSLFSLEICVSNLLSWERKWFSFSKRTRVTEQSETTLTQKTETEFNSDCFLSSCSFCYCSLLEKRERDSFVDREELKRDSSLHLSSR